MNKLVGTWRKTTTSYDAYDFLQGEAYLIPPLAAFLEKRFGLLPSRLLVSPVGDIDLDYEHFTVSGEYDGWGWLMLIATSQIGHLLLHEIAAEVERFLNDLEQEEGKREEMKTQLATLVSESLRHQTG